MLLFASNKVIFNLAKDVCETAFLTCNIDYLKRGSKREDECLFSPHSKPWSYCKLLANLFIYLFECARVCSVFACLHVCLCVYNSWTLFSPSIMWFLGIKFTLPELVSSTFTRWASHWGVFSWPLRPQTEVYSSVQTGSSSLNTKWVWLTANSFDKAYMWQSKT